MWFPVCLCGHSLCGVYNLFVCMCLFVVVYVPICRGLYVLKYRSWLKQTSLTAFFVSFFTPSLTLPLYYSMSTVAMETILLVLSSLLVCVAGKCPPCHKTQHAPSKDTSIQSVIVHREAVCDGRAWWYKERHSLVCAYSKTSIMTLCVGFTDGCVRVWGLLIVYY